MLSVSLGLLNLFPIPVLDGGHILFCAIEGIRGKPVPEKVQEYAFMVGIAIVLGVMLMSTWNDIVRLILK
jgi:regulator of sigma E protease